MKTDAERIAEYRALEDQYLDGMPLNTRCAGTARHKALGKKFRELRRTLRAEGLIPNAVDELKDICAAMKEQETTA